MNPIKISHQEIETILVFNSIEATAQAAANQIITAVNKNPTLKITFATGNTQIPLLASLAKAVEQGRVDFSQVQAFHLDEYYPISPVDPESFVYYLKDKALKPLKITPPNFHFLNGQAPDPVAETNRYDQLLTGGVDLCILGIGPGGHIGFNESGTSFKLRTHQAHLASETIIRDHQERGKKTPESSLTQGPANILEARQVLLIAFGESKAQVIKDTLMGPLSESCPASVLRLKKSAVTFYLDNQAAALLR